MTADQWTSNAEGLIRKIDSYSATFADRVWFVPLKVPLRPLMSGNCFAVVR